MISFNTPALRRNTITTTPLNIYIDVVNFHQYIEYSNPTSWTKQVTGRENGGWGQIRLKSSKQTLSSIKEQYQKNMSSLDYIEDPDSENFYHYYFLYIKPISVFYYFEH